MDATDPVAHAEASAMALANNFGSVVAISGEEDFVTDGTTVARVFGGSAVMPQITALGCSLTCLMGGFAAVAPPLVAAVAALELFAEAGEIADRSADGPGTFQPLFLDALANVTPDNLARSGRVKWQ